jgi:hypothetical protein
MRSRDRDRVRDNGPLESGASRISGGIQVGARIWPGHARGASCSEQRRGGRRWMTRGGGQRITAGAPMAHANETRRQGGGGKFRRPGVGVCWVCWVCWRLEQRCETEAEDTTRSGRSLGAAGIWRRCRRWDGRLISLRPKRGLSLASLAFLLSRPPEATRSRRQ